MTEELDLELDPEYPTGLVAARELAESLQPLDGALVQALAAAARMFSARLTDEMMLAGLTGPQWIVLHEVARARVVEPSEIARALGMARPTATEILGRLENLSLVSKRVAYSDARSRVYTPTESGRRTTVRGLRCLARATRTATAGLTDQEQEQLVRLLQHVSANLRQRLRELAA